MVLERAFRCFKWSVGILESGLCKQMYVIGAVADLPAHGLWMTLVAGYCESTSRSIGRDWVLNEPRYLG